MTAPRWLRAMCPRRRPVTVDTVVPGGRPCRCCGERPMSPDGDVWHIPGCRFDTGWLGLLSR